MLDRTLHDLMMRELLSKTSVNKTAKKDIDWGFLTQESSHQKQNKYNVKIDSWNDLLFASSDINPKVEPTSFNIHPCGFIVSDDLGQQVFNAAFSKILLQLKMQTESDENDVKDAIHNYITSNKISTKGFYYLIKKLKNLQLEDLPDLEA